MFVIITIIVYIYFNQCFDLLHNNTIILGIILKKRSQTVIHN